jgi:hypothetical protein
MGASANWRNKNAPNVAPKPKKFATNYNTNPLIQDKQKSPDSLRIKAFLVSLERAKLGYGAADGTRTRDPRRDRPVF